MKRIFGVLIVLALMFGIAACGEEESTAESTEAEASDSVVASDSVATTEPEINDDVRISDFSCDATALPLDNGEVIFFTAKIDTDKILPDDSVVINASDDLGNTYTLTMYDNGTEGDETANDGIYSVGIRNDITTPRTITFYVDANGAISDNSISVDFYEEENQFGDMLDAYQGTWEFKTSASASYYELVIIGEDIYRSYISVIGEKSFRTVHEYMFGLDENGNLLCVTQDGNALPIYMNEEGKIVLTLASGEEIYEKVSDDQTIPQDTRSPEIGMTEEEVRASTWGSPKKINKTTTQYSEHEQWVYDSGYIYFTDGVVTSIQER